MSARSGSSSIETMRPIRLTWLYQLSSSRTVSAARGSRRMNRRRRRLSSMFSSTRPFSHSYQVGTVWGEPSGRSVATTAGFGRDRNSPIFGGTGTRGTLAAYEAATADAASSGSIRTGSSARRKLRSRRGPKSRRTALLPVAFQPGVGLPERHCPLVDLDVGTTRSHVSANRLAELLLRYTLPNPTCPVCKPLPQFAEVRPGIVGDAKMHEREPARPPRRDLDDRPVPLVEVEVRRRRRRQDRSLGLEANTRSVARVEGAVAVEITDVVAGVSGRREALEPEDVGPDDSDVLLRNRRELSPERVEGIAVQAPRAGLEPAWIGEMGRSYLGDVDLQRRMLAH